MGKSRVNIAKIKEYLQTADLSVGHMEAVAELFHVHNKTLSVALQNRFTNLGKLIEEERQRRRLIWEKEGGGDVSELLRRLGYGPRSKYGRAIVEELSRG